MLHSILIAHRDRNDRLALCLWSIQRSASLCEVDGWEIVVVDQGSGVRPNNDSRGHVRIVIDKKARQVFNKAQALNLGIEASQGDILTILDADVMVGERFMEAVVPLTVPSCNRVCYRVRCLPETEIGTLVDLKGREEEAENVFLRYDTFPKGYEAYGTHDNFRGVDRKSDQPWGNSQFSICRNVLGDLRYDESYVGHGCEDMDLSAKLEHKLGQDHHGHIWTDPAHALLHLEHSPGAWQVKKTTLANYLRYRTKRKELLGR